MPGDTRTVKPAQANTSKPQRTERGAGEQRSSRPTAQLLFQQERRLPCPADMAALSPSLHPVADAAGKPHRGLLEAEPGESGTRDPGPGRTQPWVPHEGTLSRPRSTEPFLGASSPHFAPAVAQLLPGPAANRDTTPSSSMSHDTEPQTEHQHRWQSSGRES